MTQRSKIKRHGARSDPREARVAQVSDGTELTFSAERAVPESLPNRRGRYRELIERATLRSGAPHFAKAMAAPSTL